MGIESLSSGCLTHSILYQKALSRYLEAIADDMEDMAPDYKPVFIAIISTTVIHWHHSLI